MKIQSLDLKIIEKELEEKLGYLESQSRKVNDLLKNDSSNNDLIFVLKSLYNIVLQIKHSHNFICNHDYSMSEILSLTDIPSDFFNNIQLLSSKLYIPVNKIVNALMEVMLLNRTEDGPDDMFNLNKNHLRRKLLKNNYEIIVSKKDFLEVTKTDLSEKDIIFSFDSIEILIFKNISGSDFQNLIGFINNCKIVFIHDDIPKLLIYSKITNVESIKIYKSLDDVYDAVFIFK